jgi:hypothetical protein
MLKAPKRVNTIYWEKQENGLLPGTASLALDVHAHILSGVEWHCQSCTALFSPHQ